MAAITKAMAVAKVIKSTAVKRVEKKIFLNRSFIGKMYLLISGCKNTVFQEIIFVLTYIICSIINS